MEGENRPKILGRGRHYSSDSREREAIGLRLKREGGIPVREREKRPHIGWGKRNMPQIKALSLRETSWACWPQIPWQGNRP